MLGFDQIQNKVSWIKYNFAFILTCETVKMFNLEKLGYVIFKLLR